MLKDNTTLKDKLQIAYDDIPGDCILYQYYNNEDVEAAVLEFDNFLKKYCIKGWDDEILKKYKAIFGDFEN